MKNLIIIILLGSSFISLTQLMLASVDVAFPLSYCLGLNLIHFERKTKNTFDSFSLKSEVFLPKMPKTDQTS